MWYWIGMVFAAFLFLFEIFRADQIPNKPLENNKIASVMTLGNAFRKYYNETTDLIIPGGDMTETLKANYLPKQVRIPDDHKTVVRCVNKENELEQVVCGLESANLYAVTYVPLELEDGPEKTDFLKELNTKTEGGRTFGIWKKNGEIETLSGVKTSMPGVFSDIRVSLPENVLVMLDKGPLTCLSPRVHKLWTYGCKCPENSIFAFGTCLTNNTYSASPVGHEKPLTEKEFCTALHNGIPELLPFDDNPSFPSNTGVYQATLEPGVTLRTFKGDSVLYKRLEIYAIDGKSCFINLGHSGGRSIAFHTCSEAACGLKQTTSGEFLITTDTQVTSTSSVWTANASTNTFQLGLAYFLNIISQGLAQLP